MYTQGAGSGLEGKRLVVTETTTMMVRTFVSTADTHPHTHTRTNTEQ